MPDTSPRLPFEIDETIDPALVTGRAGVPLVIELFRQLGVAQAIDAEVAVKQRQRGPSSSQVVESLIALWASGGDRCQDLTPLREDQALATLLGHPLPAATTVRDFLDACHVEQVVEAVLHLQLFCISGRIFVLDRILTLEPPGEIHRHEPP